MAEKNNYKYKFSVVIPIYNVENYLRETIESVIHQTIGFKENIQIILVNDGSPDNSEAICLEYKEKYPDNIIYVKQENAGVSAARNTGMQYIEGKYTNFLDSDDKWDLNAFKKVYNYFEQHYHEINVIGCRIEYFEARQGFHILDFTFDKGTRIVDIQKEHDAIHIHNATCFLKSDILKENKFNTKLEYAEDSVFLTNIIINDGKYGLMAEAIYHYRIRSNQSSAVQNKKSNRSWYIHTMEDNYGYLIEQSKKKYSQIIPYVQYVIMYDIQFRLKEEMPRELFDIKETYLSKLKQLLNLIDDEIILEQQRLYGEYKILALNLKYGRDIREELQYDNGKLYFNKLFVTNTSKRALRLDVMELHGQNLILGGRFSSVLDFSQYQVWMEQNSKEKKSLSLFEIPHGIKKDMLGNVIKKMYGFKLCVPIHDVQNIQFLMQYKTHTPKKLTINFGKKAKLNNLIPNSYYNNEVYTITAKNNVLNIHKNTKINHVKRELKYWKSLLRRGHLKPIWYRLCYFLQRLTKRKQVWLVSDRTMVANDNGMHLFKYICAQNNKEIKPYFVIDRHSPDYQKMKKIGSVLPHNTFRYRIKFLMADKIISSQADDWVYNAFNDEETYYRDLYKYQLIFLQHGIIKDDLSRWLQYYNKNLKMFVTSAEREYNSIIQGNYYYDDTVVKITGLPRYDNLENKPEKMIAIMPTWRKSLAGSINAVKGTREYNPQFKKSEYARFYNRLINDEKLIETMKQKGYRGIFVVHPSHVENRIDFKSDMFEIVNGFADYQEIFGKASLLVSDYSSVPFDFAYLRKPVIYTQFDKKEFFSGHLYEEGYFSYDEDGFGPVCYNYEDTVNEMIKTIENDCKLKDTYLKRINDFYQYNDRNNCQRVYEEILKLK